jgi:NodT family efflux transporter outer membrane factor (OMF) lipoprotein
METQLAIARENVTKQRRALEIARDRNQGGAATALDVYQAQNVLAQTEASIPKLTAQLDQGKSALRVQLGLAPQSLDAQLAGSQTIPVPPQDIAVGIPADLVRRRPDIRSAELKAAAQSAKIGMTKAELFPAFSLTGTFGSTRGGSSENPLDQVFTSHSLFFGFGPGFTWPILSYGQITNKVRVQDARLQALLLEYQNTVLKAQQEVETGLSAFLNGGRQVVLLKQSVDAANHAMQIALDQYTLGTRDFTTVLTAAQNLYQAQSNLASAEGNVSTSLTNVYRSLGGGWQIRGDGEFINDSVRAEMRDRTAWGGLLPAAGPPPQPTPGLPGPDDTGPNVRAPQW